MQVTPGREDTPSAGLASGVHSYLGGSPPKVSSASTCLSLASHQFSLPPSLDPGTSWGIRGNPCPACVAVGVAGSKKSSSASELDMAPSE